jgi:P-type conjugative transfer protein TrbJ
MKNKSFRGLLMGLLLAISGQAMATDIVFDPTNFSKNLVTSREAVRQTATQAQMLSTEISHYQLMLQNMKSLNPQIILDGINRGLIPPGDYDNVGDVLAASKGVYGASQGIYQAMSGMNTVYNDYERMAGDLERESIATRMTPEEVMQYHYKRAKQGRSSGKNYYLEAQRLQQNLNQHSVRQKQIMEGIPKNNPSMIQLLQTVTAQNNLTQDQMSHLIQVATIQTALAADKSVQEDERVISGKAETDRAVLQNNRAMEYFRKDK